MQYVNNSSVTVRHRIDIQNVQAESTFSRKGGRQWSEIVIENLYKSFDTKDGPVEALKNVNLSIESGDIYGIIGMSGAGKSTLVRCINFLEVPTKGRVLINGKSLGDYTSRELRNAKRR